jgi:hypothetical protein
VEKIKDSTQKTFRNEYLTNEILEEFRKAIMDMWFSEENV